MSKYLGKYKNDSNRLRSWNYSSPGRYYITICTHNREHLFGQVENGNMILSEYGEIVRSEILKIPEYHKRAILDEWIVMPDHVHLLIELGTWNYENGISSIGDTDVVGKIHEISLQSCSPNDQIKQYRAARRKMIIFKIVGKFQMLTSKQINILRNSPGNTNWQHDYYDHVIRNYESYIRIKQYIINNPKNFRKN